MIKDKSIESLLFDISSKLSLGNDLTNIENMIQHGLKIIDFYHKEILLRKFTLLFFQDRWLELNELISYMLVKWSNDCEVVFLKGKFCFYFGCWEDAISYYINSLEIWNNEKGEDLKEELYYDLISCLYAIGKKQDCINYCELLIANSTSDSSKWKNIQEKIIDDTFTKPIAICDQSMGR
jgi:tetratricopeptide (TPR) repeat protein